MNQTHNGLTAPHDQPVKNTIKQDRHFTTNQLKNAVCRSRCGIINPKAKAPVIQNTTFVRSNRPDSAVSLCPDSVIGFWADGPFREAGRTATTSVLNICPPTALQNAVVELKTRCRSMTMPTGTSTGASAQNNHDHTTLSFIRVEFKGPRKQRLTDWFNVPDEDYGSGNARGYRVAAEFMSWVQSRPASYETGMIVREIMAAAFAVLAAPCSPGTHCKRGAAVSFLDAMAECVMFVAGCTNHQTYLEGKAQHSEDWKKESALRDSERNRETGRRLAAARAAKRAARMAESEVQA